MDGNGARSDEMSCLSRAPVDQKSRCHQEQVYVYRGGRVARLPPFHEAENEVVVAVWCCYRKLQWSSLSGHREGTYLR